MSESKRKRPLLAGFLNLFFVTGPGYLYLGQRRKGWVALALFLGLQLVNLGGTFVPQGVTTRLIWPIAWAFQLLTALDAFLLARRHNAGETVGPLDTEVPVLRFMGHAPGRTQLPDP